MGAVSKKRAYFFGLCAEIWAACYLVATGHRILKWRYKTSFGELDLIAMKQNVVVVAEVKARANIEEASMALTRRSQKRICKAAELFLMQNPDYVDKTIRFDLIAINGIGRLRHLDNAWSYSA